MFTNPAINHRHFQPLVQFPATGSLAPQGDIRCPNHFSKTVRERQFKRRLTPRHREILARYLHGQTLRQISKETRIGEQWLLVVVNSELFQLELQARLREQDEEIVRRLNERD